MIVYGDPQFTATAEELITALRQRGMNAHDDDELRALLIAAGELEQAIADRLDDPNVMRAAEQITDYLARHFVSSYSRSVFVPETKTFVELLNLLRVKLGSHANGKLRVKVPEGFAFYTLYPEHYVLAAQRWSEDHSGARARTVCVVGLRSIGTTLSAVVAAALALRGWRAHRVSARPCGHPFAREVALTREQLGDARFVIIADEGPGLSGSSMSAVAVAARELQVDADAIAFFPAHNNEPGSAASAEVREIWRTTKRYTAELSDLRWNGRSLQQELAETTERIVGAKVNAIHDVSGGLWRRLAYDDERDWPAVSIGFERTKFLIEAGGQRMLWKFEGLRTSQPIMHTNFFSRSRDSNSLPMPCGHGSTLAVVPSLAFRLGFAMQPWIEGQRANASDWPIFSESIARYIEQFSQSPLSPNQAREAITRLEAMACHNSAGFVPESSVLKLADAAREFLRHHATRSYGDGRMAPHEFVSGFPVSFKTDSGGHHFDHTMIGAQSVLWDIAGVCVEWALPGGASDYLLRLGFDEEANDALRFHRLAYAAFRLGMVTLSLSRADEAEQRRLLKAAEFYKTAIARCVSMESNHVHGPHNGRVIVH